jgi:UDP-glucuronate 4-epimerase
VDRVVVASSSSVYGNRSEVPFSEEDPVGEPISPYAASKRACELIGHAYHHLHGLPIAMLRFFTVYGPRQRPDLAIAKFIDLIESGRPIPMFGDGTSSRDYTYIEDIVAGVLSSHDRIVEHGYRIWNLGGNHPVTLSEMIETVADACGREAQIERVSMQPGDVEKTYADLSRSGSELDYAPTTSFSDGVAKQVAAVRRLAEASVNG